MMRTIDDTIEIDVQGHGRWLSRFSVHHLRPVENTSLSYASIRHLSQNHVSLQGASSNGRTYHHVYSTKRRYPELKQSQLTIPIRDVTLPTDRLPVCKRSCQRGTRINQHRTIFGYHVPSRHFDLRHHFIYAGSVEVTQNELGPGLLTHSDARSMDVLF